MEFCCLIRFENLSRHQSLSVQTFLRGLKESQRRYGRAGVATSQGDLRYASGEPVRGHSTTLVTIFGGWL